MGNITQTNLEVIRLQPKDITIDPKYNVRPFSQHHTEAEDKLVEQLAYSMEATGQLDNILITQQHVLIFGHRRRRAAMVINERRSACGEPLFQLNCTVDQAGGDLWRKAIMSNLHRKESSVMELAFLITQIRDKFNWRGNDGYTKVAEYLGIQRSAVYEAERFLSAPGQIQTMLHMGYLSVQSALRLMRKVPLKEQPKAIELGHQYQEEDRLEKALNKCEKTKASPEEAARLIRQPESKRIEAPAMARAIRDITTGKVPLTRVELISGLRRLRQPDLSPSHLKFLDYLLDTFATGQGNIKELRARFAMIGVAMPPPFINGISVHSPPN